MLAHLLAASLLALPVQQDTTRVTATVSDNTVVVGEEIRLDVTVEAGGARPSAMDLAPLPVGLVVVRRDHATNVAIDATGGRRILTSQAWTIVARAPGSYTLPSVSIVLGRRIHRTSPIQVTVLDAPDGGVPPDPASRVRLTGRVEPERIYVGQQVTFTAEAEFPRSLKQRQTRPATYQAPNPSGFWAQDLPDPIVIGVRYIDGELYDTQSFHRAYFPLLPGPQTLPPAKLNLDYRGSFGGLAESRELLSDTLHIDVLPVPEEGRPASFNGAVGSYSMRTTVDSDRLRVDEATTLRVEVTGTGNVKSLPAPSLVAPDGLEVFPPTESADVESSTMDLGGTKRFEWVIVPGDPGRVVIPPVEYVAFDPVEEAFDVLRSDSIVLSVTGRPAANAPGVDLRPIRGRPSDGTPSWVLSPMFALVQVIPLLILFGAWLSVREPSVPGQKRVTEDRARRFARMEHEALAPDRGFWGRLSETVRVSIAEALESPGLRLAPVDTLHQAMLDAGVPRATAGALAEVLRGLDRIRYAPGAVTPADAPGMVDRARSLLDAMAASVARSSPRRSTVTGIALLLLLPGLVDAQEPAFARAVQAYRDADYAAAADAFMEHVASNPADADGWYDAGNALFRSGDSGRAVAAWVRAVRLRPWHRDARSNLEVVSPGALGFAPPRISLTLPATVLALAGVWWICALLAAIRLRGHRRVGTVIGPAIAAAALVAVAGIAGLGQRDAAVSLGDAVVRADPALKAEAVERLPAGAIVEVIDRRDTWLHVRTVPGVEGWVDGSLVDEV